MLENISQFFEDLSDDYYASLIYTRFLYIAGPILTLIALIVCFWTPAWRVVGDIKLEDYINKKYDVAERQVIYDDNCLIAYTGKTVKGARFLVAYSIDKGVVDETDYGVKETQPTVSNVEKSKEESSAESNVYSNSPED